MVRPGPDPFKVSREATQARDGLLDVADHVHGSLSVPTLYHGTDEVHAR
jgi:hypothetical protein